MKKHFIKYLLDAVLFVNLCSIAAIGLILAFAVSGGEAGRGAKFFLGLHRHDWGDIHLFLSASLVPLLAVHLWFNWPWIVQSSKKYFGDHWKNALWGMTGAWILVLIIAWIVTKF